MTEENIAFISNSSSSSVSVTSSKSVASSTHWNEKKMEIEKESIQKLMLPAHRSSGKLNSHQQRQAPGAHVNDDRCLAISVNRMESLKNGVQIQPSSEPWNEELQRIEGLKEDFLSTVSHELKTPLASMYMSIQLLELLLLESSDELDAPALHPSMEVSDALRYKSMTSEQSGRSSYKESWPQERTGKKAKIRQYLGTLSKECRREIALINNLISLKESLARLPSPAMGCIFVHDWLNEFIKPFYDEFKRKRHQFSYYVSPTLSYLVSDRIRLEGILQELMTNACKFTPEEEKISLSMVEQDDFVILTVSNKGDAIPLEELPHLFSMFYRVPNSDPWRTGGTGIGLALVKKMSEAIGGDIQVGIGAFGNAFTLRLPKINP